jgi:hypothetical protein
MGGCASASSAANPSPVAAVSRSSLQSAQAAAASAESTASTLTAAVKSISALANSYDFYSDNSQLDVSAPAAAPPTSNSGNDTAICSPQANLDSLYPVELLQPLVAFFTGMRDSNGCSYPDEAISDVCSSICAAAARDHPTKLQEQDLSWPKSVRKRSNSQPNGSMKTRACVPSTWTTQRSAPKATRSFPLPTTASLNMSHIASCVVFAMKLLRIQAHRSGTCAASRAVAAGMPSAAAA